MHIDATFFALVALIIFLAVAAYAGAFRSMGAGLDGRAQRIQKDLDEAATLRKEAEALLAEYKQKRAAAEKEAEDIVAQAKASAEEYASETRRKLAESIERRTLQAEQKIARPKPPRSRMCVAPSPMWRLPPLPRSPPNSSRVARVPTSSSSRLRP